MKIAVVILMLCVHTPLFADVIQLRADVWCPYTCEHESDLPGYIVEAVKIIFKDAGHTIDYKTMNWARSLRDTRNGSYTGVIGASRTEAQGLVLPTVEQGRFYDSLWTKAGSKWKYSSINSLTDIRLGLTYGYDYGETISNFIKSRPKNIQFVTGDDPIKRNIRKLLANRVDVILVESNVMKFISMLMQVKSKLKRVADIKVDKPEDRNLFVAFSSKNPKAKDYARILSGGWVKLRDSGKLTKILAKYGLKDWRN